MNADPNLKDGKGIQKGSLEEFLHYLSTEVGEEIEIAWRSSIFFLNARIRTD